MPFRRTFYFWGRTCKMFWQERKRLKGEKQANCLLSAAVPVSNSTHCRCRSRCAVLQDVMSSVWCVPSRGRLRINSHCLCSSLSTCTDLGVFCSPCLVFHPEDGGITSLRNFNKRTKLRTNLKSDCKITLWYEAFRATDFWAIRRIKYGVDNVSECVYASIIRTWCYLRIRTLCLFKTLDTDSILTRPIARIDLITG
jgi:hypothetical protein